MNSLIITRKLRFNPRLRGGGDVNYPLRLHLNLLFQSTPPGGRRPNITSASLE